jgi:CBS domain containing-hemolysin-like protein
MVLAVLIIVFAAAAEAALVALSRSSARRLIGEGVSRAKALQTLLDDPPRFLAALTALKVSAYAAAAALGTLFAVRWGGRWPTGALILALTLVVLVMLCAQTVARAMAVRHLERTALRLGPWVRRVSIVLSPLTRLLTALELMVLGRSNAVIPDDGFLSDDGLRLLIQASEDPGLIEADEKEMIASIIELGETVVREVMVPRIDVVAVDETSSLQDALDIIIAAGHSRIPVYRETVDNIQGVFYAKDLLRPFREGRYEGPITELMRPAYFVPESKKVDELLRELKQRKVHMAIVVDEYGGTAGVVTIEDLLEEIVGDIQDEYDSEAPMVTRNGENEYLFDARISLDEVSRLVGVDLPTEESDTLGGFIFSQLGRVPTAGSQVLFGPLTLDVQSISGRRIQQVRVTRLPESASSAEEAGAHIRKPLSAFTSML